MPEYILKPYQKGFEQDQARIGIEVARGWIWPYAYDQDDLQIAHSKSDFDPDTCHFCFLGEKMVGYMVATIMQQGDNGAIVASLDFPRMLAGHEQAAEMLIEQAFETLKEKGVSCIEGRVTTMSPSDIRLAEKTGFSIYDWGYKVYYAYKMKWGRLDILADAAGEIDPQKDLEDCARLATLWYGRSEQWCRDLLKEWHQMGIITHVGVRKHGKLVASCMTAPNVLRPSTAANYYIFAPHEQDLIPMLALVINKCIEFGALEVIADLINDHRHYEPVYQALGFKKAAEWAHCRKTIG